MAASVQVLCPNGHRQTVKMNNNTTLLQVLEEVCIKQGFKPVEEFELRQGRKAVDLSSNLRFSGLPNHAKLDLVRSEKKRNESDVHLALQLEDGARLQAKFTPVTSLWQILEHWENTETKYKGMLASTTTGQPVCIYMRDEIIGEFALKEKSLKSLGLVGGKAAIRLVHRQVDSNVLEAVQQDIEQKKLRHTRLAAQAAQRPSPMSIDSSSDSNDVTMVTASTRTLQAESMEIDADSPGPSGLQSPVQGVSGLQNYSRVFLTEENDQLTPQQRQKSERLAQVIMPGNTQRTRTPVQPQQQRVIVPAVPQPTPLSNFKFPEDTKGKDIYKNEYSDVNRQEYLPCDRNEVIFKIDSNEYKHEETDDISESFFEVTEKDVRTMYTDLQRQASQEEPLMTAAMRQAKENAKVEKYQTVVIRIHFPDHYVLQAFFRPREPVHNLSKFVKGHLMDENISFYLYTAPPKRVLNDRSATLVEANLIPMSLVYFGAGDNKTGPFLKPELISQLQSQVEADKMVAKILQGNRSSVAEGISESGTKRATTSGPRSTDGSSAGQNTSGKKVPKWFKVGK